MTGLRAAVVEALQPYIEVDPAIEPNEWALAQHHMAGIALDAVLDTLADRADEWDDLAESMWQVSPIENQRDWWHPHFRIAVLRGDTE